VGTGFSATNAKRVCAQIMLKSSVIRFQSIRCKKPATDFTGRGLFDFGDDEDMPVICPTCQIFRKG